MNAKIFKNKPYSNRTKETMEIYMENEFLFRLFSMGSNKHVIRTIKRFPNPNAKINV